MVDTMAIAVKKSFQYDKRQLIELKQRQISCEKNIKLRVKKQGKSRQNLPNTH